MDNIDINLQQYLYSGLTQDKVETGDLLIGEPMMEDTFFGRSVCLIIDEPTPGSHVGLLLNKRLDVSLNQLVPDLEIEKDVKIYCGGPVELERLIALHTLGNQLGESTEILPGLFLGADLERLFDYISSETSIEGKIKLFLGYSGWSEGQLEKEISNSTWAVDKSKEVTNLLRGEGLPFWQEKVRKMGEPLKSWLNVPPNPYCN